MDNPAWRQRISKLIWYGSLYLLICGVLFILWIRFLVSPNVPPLWQQIVGGVLLPFGLLIKIPANSFGGIAICMLLNTLFWGILVSIVGERTLHKQS